MRNLTAQQAMAEAQAPRSSLANLEDRAVGVPPEIEEHYGQTVHIQSPLEVLQAGAPGHARGRLENIEAFRNEVFESPIWTLDPPYSLANWGSILDKMGVDPYVARRLANLASTDPMAHAEASRILYHLLKPGASFGPRGPSAWLNGVITEAEDYIAHWEEWESRAPFQGASRSRPHLRRGMAEEPQAYGGPRGPRPEEAPRGPRPQTAPWAPPHMRTEGASGASSSAGPPPAAAPAQRYWTPGSETPWGQWRPTGGSGPSA